MKEVLNYIDGSFCGGGKKHQRNSPLDNLPFSLTSYATTQDVDRAVTAARRAQKVWVKSSLSERTQYISRLAAALRKRYGAAGEATDLKKTIQNEVGKPLPEADIEVLETAEFIDYFTRVATEALADEKLELNSELWPTKTSTVVHEPYGVVAIVKPWNYPLELIAWSLAPALIAGNAVVIKPSEKSPVTANIFADAAKEVGIPGGVLNIVHGDAAVGRKLVGHPFINYVTFTGSKAAGSEVARKCATTFRPCSLELSGNDVALVLKDADPKWVSHGLVWGAFCNAGQVCVGIKGVFVPRTRLDVYKDEICHLVDALELGRDVGPIVDQAQLDSFMSAIGKLRSEGAQFLRGGQRSNRAGLYVEPTVVTVDKKSIAHREEVFGPLLPIYAYDDEAAVIEEIATAEFALGASIWTTNPSRGYEIAKQLDVGTVWINDVNVAFAEAPWPARRQSGLGFSLSKDALKAFTHPKHISIDSDIEKPRFWWYPYK